MTKMQIGVMVSALALFLFLYFGLSPIPPKQKATENSRAMRGAATDFEQLLADALSHADGRTAQSFNDLTARLNAAATDSDRSKVLEQLSALWYAAGQLAVAGGYADQVAELAGTDTAWSVAGATYFNALVGAENPTLRAYCAQRSVAAFEKAVSLGQAVVEHGINLALVYAEQPPADNPMKAVLMLRDYEKKHPNNPSVYNALGRLAIKTGQWERAVSRLEKAWQLDKNNPNTPCLLSKAYEGVGNLDKATEFAKICRK